MILVVKEEEVKRLSLPEKRLHLFKDRGEIEVSLEEIGNRRITITRKKDVDFLIKKGKLGRSAKWRFRDRKWVILNYHQIQEINTNIEADVVHTWYKYTIVVCNKYLILHQRDQTMKPYSEALEQNVRDITHDVIVVLLTRKPQEREGLIMIPNLIKQVIRANDLYRKYIRWM